MIRIVGVQRNERPEREFVLLQNQGNMRFVLRGHALLSEDSISAGDLWSGAAVLSDDVPIPPGKFVIAVSGQGENHWGTTRDGQMAYFVYLGRAHPIWNAKPGAIHILNTQHTYVERGEALLLR